MYELIKVSARDHYIQSPAKIGLIRLDEKNICLIDSGSDRDAGKKVRQILDVNSWRLTVIYNTHSNADHIGGNRYLQTNTGCKIYAPGVECAFTRAPALEPTFLYGGFPFAELRHKFLMAQESDAKELSPEVLPEGMEIIPLPGHFLDMVGLRTADGTVYLADCLSSVETLEKYRIVFIFDVASYLKTLETVKNMQANLFVPAHAEACEDISGLAQYNIGRVYEVAEKLLFICGRPIGFETILQRLFTDFGLKMTYEQYVLVGSTVRSYLSWLKDEKMLDCMFDKNLMLWHRT
ncbi:MAG: MBL fold metallo-hydrolase [Clostridia bacterium]|nr:MBL fold metallo-hydrolase [Clostridia bacterium]